MKNISLFIICSIVLSCGETEKTAPLPIPDLDRRNEMIAEAREKIDFLKVASGNQALALLDHPDHRVRRAALKRLGELKEAPKPAVEALLKSLKDESDEVRIEAAISLSTMTTSAAVRPLIRALGDPNSKVRQWAYKGLKKLGPQAVPEMLKELSSSAEGGGIETIIIDSLSGMGKAAVPYLITTIREQRGKTAREAVDLLGKIGREAADGIYVLLEILSNNADPDLKKRAIAAIGNIGDVDPEVVPTLMTLAEDVTGAYAKEAKKALKKMEENS
jgi:HEAT repeat protein